MCLCNVYFFAVGLWQLWRRLTEEFLAPSIARARANAPLSEASQQNFGKVVKGAIAALALVGPALLESAAQSASS